MQKRESRELRKLVAALSQAQSAGNRAGRGLHDHVGPLLTAAGLRLQLLCLDQPSAGKPVGLVLQSLDEAMEQVRQMSESLAPCPAYRIGIHGALKKLVEERRAGFPGKIQLKFSATTKLEPEPAALFYDAIASVFGEAIARPGSSRVTISVTGSRRKVTARVQDNGRKTTQGVASIPLLLAEEAGFVYSQTTGKGTIVLIRYGIPRPPRG